MPPTSQPLFGSALTNRDIETRVSVELARVAQARQVVGQLREVLSQRDRGNPDAWVTPGLRRLDSRHVVEAALDRVDEMIEEAGL